MTVALLDPSEFDPSFSGFLLGFADGLAKLPFLLPELAPEFVIALAMLLSHAIGSRAMLVDHVLQRIAMRLFRRSEPLDCGLLLPPGEIVGLSRICGLPLKPVGPLLFQMGLVLGRMKIAAQLERGEMMSGDSKAVVNVRRGRQTVRQIAMILVNEVTAKAVEKRLLIAASDHFIPPEMIRRVPACSGRWLR